MASYTDINPAQIIINNVSREKYKELSNSNGLCSDQIYVIKDLQLNAVGLKIPNVLDPSELSDAANKKYVDSEISNSLSNYYDKSTIDTRFSKYTVINKLTQAEYDILSAAGQIKEDELYVITDSKTTDEILDGRLSSYYTKTQTNALSTTFRSGLVETTSLTAYETKSDLTANYYKKSETSSSSQLTTEFAKYQSKGDYLLSSNLSFAYDSTNKKINLSAFGNKIGQVDCADFIKDGMLSTVTLTGNILVFKFNTDAGITPISVDLAKFVDNYDEKINTLSNAITSITKDYTTSGQTSSIVEGYGYTKTFVDGTKDDISAVHVSKSEYDEMLTAGNLISNVLYVVSSDTVDMYGQRVVDVADPVDLSDATNKEYVDSQIGNLTGVYQAKGNYLTSTTERTTSAQVSSIAKAYSDSVKISDYTTSAQASSIVEGYGYTRSFVDGELKDLSVQNVTKDQYIDLVKKGTLLSNVIYNVSADGLDGFGSPIENVGTPVLTSDAATKGYVDSEIEKIDVSDQLTGFYKKTETSSSGEIKQALDKLATSANVSSIVENYKYSRIDINGTRSDLSIINISSDEYHNLTEEQRAISNILYVVSYDNDNLYGERITNLGEPVESSDATTKNYVDSEIDGLSNAYQAKGNYLTSTALNDYYKKSETSSSSQISSSFSKVSIRDSIDGISEKKSDLNVMKVTKEEYDSIMETSSTSQLSNYIFDVSSDTMDAYGRVVENVATPSSDTDAANKKYVDDKVPTRVSDLENDLNYLTLLQLSSFVKNTDVIPETVEDGVKIATIGTKTIYAPQGGGGSGGGTTYSPVVVKFNANSYSTSLTLGELTINGSGSANYYTFTVAGGTTQEFSISNGQYMVFYVPSTDSTAGTIQNIYSGSCLKFDTMILMSDGTTKMIKDVVVGDMVMSLDPQSGILVPDEVIIAETGENRVHNKFTIWKFDDGTEVSTVKRHRFYNKDLNEFMYMEAWNMGEESAMKQNGNTVKLVSKQDFDEEVRHCTIFTKKYNNYFANGLLSGNRHSVHIKAFEK